MLATRVLPNAQRCLGCGFNTLSAFASLAGISISQHAVRLPTNSSTFSRQLALSHVYRAENEKTSNIQQQRKDFIGEDDILVEEDVGTERQSAQEASIPWYLQVQPPQRAEGPMSERQRLPPLPEHPPPLLQPIIEHLSIDIGLDDLTLLDLRRLDPPPALGGNLLMILGTARSEKHLHVSADRFCRWLRSNHKLAPYADGLLGRNELKLKMRRKARRAKLLGSIASVDNGDVDDGIRTGWVCVNIGSIEEAPGFQQEALHTEGFVGFGGPEEGVKLVIQMLTETKREELDLETLWGGFLARQQRKKARDAEKDLEETRMEEVDQQAIERQNSTNRA